MKITKKELNGMIEEAVSVRLNEGNRMDGLVDSTQLKNFVNAIKSVFSDLTDEGYEHQDVTKYLQGVINSEIKKLK